MTDFVHLHLHTEYSLLDGAVKVDDLVRHCVENNIDTVAVTDHGNMYSSLRFAEKCKKNKIKAIIGCEFYVVDNYRERIDQKADHLILLAKNKAGYINLVQLDSLAFVDGFYYRPRIDYTVLKEHTEGVICLSACLAGRIPRLLMAGEYEKAKEFALYMQGLFGEDFYLEIQDHGLAEQKRILPDLVRLSKETGIELVATNDVHYLRSEDWEMQDVLMCIQMKKTLDDPARMKMETKEFYMKSGDEMAALFPHLPQAIANTRVIANKISDTDTPFNLKPNGDPVYDKSLIPLYTADDGTSSDDYLRRLTWEGLSTRYPEITEEIRARAEYELSVIIKMGFADYYLIVWDYINWSRLHDIPVGPGRGSGVGSIVAYAIGITNVDPLRYDLLFERFLNPDRVSMPDFDVDFCTARREETIEYVRRRYHPENVAQIITFGTLASRAAIKDVGRVMRVPYADTDRVTKLMDGKSTIRELLGLNLAGCRKKIEKLAEEVAEQKNIVASAPNGAEGEAAMKLADLQSKLDEAQKKLSDQEGKRNAEFIEIYESDETLKRVIDMGLKLEGMPRNTSKHAAGVVICRKKIADNVPLSRNNEDITTQFDMKEVESIGMLKMDFLALTTLTDIKKALDYIKEDTGRTVTFDQSCDDPGAYALISEGDTDAVFQLEQGGMKRFMKQLQPNCLEDLIAGISLYRPGPMDFIPNYLKNRADPQHIEYLTPLLRPILEKTYGVIIYQEQVMQIFQNLAGYSLGQADLVRRAMSKKHLNELMAQKEKFIYGDIEKGGNITGCVARGIAPEVAAELFGQMESFASYAFNKSHAAAYSVVTYQTAFLKKYYPKEFLAGVLNNRIDKIEEIAKYVVYMKEKNIAVYPPDVNCSKAYFSVQDKGLRFGLCALRGVGIGAMEAVIAEREKNGPFKDFPDFLMRCIKFVNRRMVEALIFGGAFDGMGKRRSQYAAVCEELMRRIAGMDKQRSGLQMSLFGDIIAEEAPKAEYPDIPEWDTMDLLSKEKSVLGVYVSGHPFGMYAKHFERCNFHCGMLADYEEDEETGDRVYQRIKSGDAVTMGGIVSSVKRINTKSGTTMAFITLEDLYGSIECVAFPRIFEKAKPFLRQDAVVSVAGKIDIAPEKLPVIVLDTLEGFTPSEEKREPVREEPKEQVLWLDARAMSEEDFSELIEAVMQYEGNMKAKILHGGKRYEFSVNLSRALSAELRTFLPAACIKLV
ncbi:MAG: DNA polymerase III subunit alpha [Clostridia bacterium]|nr:DNA polymerase III subunit alpha [Clostridia bacterium]